MELSSDPKNPAFALHLAELLASLLNPDSIGTIDNRLSMDAGRPVESRFVGPTTNTPAWYAAKAGEFAVVLVSGCSLFSHARLTIDAFQGGLTSPIREPESTYFRGLATDFFSILEVEGYLAASKYLLAGHSLGGAVCEHLLSMLVGPKGQENCCLCSFGAPKPGGATFAQKVPIERRARWFCSDDPVPLLPPSPGLLPSLFLAHNVFQLQRFSNFVHPAGGLQLAPSGEITPEVLPQDASLNASGSLAGWLLAVDGSSSSGHHIASYQSRLSYWLRNHPPPAGQLPEPAQAEKSEASGRAYLTDAQREVSRTIADLSAVQNREPVKIPESAGFKYARAGRFHIVTFNGATVAVTSRERSARAVAREGNDMLRSLQRQAVVMPVELTAQLENYFFLAQTAGTGFTPVMNVQLPDDPS